MGKLVILIIAVSAFSFILSNPGNKSYEFPSLTFFPAMPTNPNNPVTKKGAELGKYLFYDSILSSDNNMACATCHKQKYAFSDSPNKFTRGRNNSLMKRNTMPLFNLAWYPSYFWDGKANSIEEQIFHPVRDKNEMNLSWKYAEDRIKKSKFYEKLFKQSFGKTPIDSILISKAIAQFLRTLISCRSKYDLVLEKKMKFTADEYEGFVLINDQTKGDCLHCHTTDGNALGTTGKFSNNGIDKVEKTNEFIDIGRGGITGKTEDNGKFKIPSLRNLVFTAPYMHDGRFSTIEEVVEFYSSGVKKSPTIDPKMEYAHQGGVQLSKDEKRKIVAFLKTLSDSSFILNPEFRNPFKIK